MDTARNEGRKEKEKYDVFGIIIEGDVDAEQFFKYGKLLKAELEKAYQEQWKAIGRVNTIKSQIELYKQFLKSIFPQVPQEKRKEDDEKRAEKVKEEIDIEKLKEEFIKHKKCWWKDRTMVSHCGAEGYEMAGGVWYCEKHYKMAVGEIERPLKPVPELKDDGVKKKEKERKKKKKSSGGEKDKDEGGV